MSVDDFLSNGEASTTAAGSASVKSTTCLSETQLQRILWSRFESLVGQQVFRLRVEGEAANIPSSLCSLLSSDFSSPERIAGFEPRCIQSGDLQRNTNALEIDKQPLYGIRYITQSTSPLLSLVLLTMQELRSLQRNLDPCEALRRLRNIKRSLLDVHKKALLLESQLHQYINPTLVTTLNRRAAKATFEAELMCKLIDKLRKDSRQSASEPEKRKRVCELTMKMKTLLCRQKCEWQCVGRLKETLAMARDMKGVLKFICQLSCLLEHCSDASRRLTERPPPYEYSSSSKQDSSDALYEDLKSKDNHRPQPTQSQSSHSEVTISLSLDFTSDREFCERSYDSDSNTGTRTSKSRQRNTSSENFKDDKSNSDANTVRSKRSRRLQEDSVRSNRISPQTRNRRAKSASSVSSTKMNRRSRKNIGDSDSKISTHGKSHRSSSDPTTAEVMHQDSDTSKTSRSRRFTSPKKSHILKDVPQSKILAKETINDLIEVLEDFIDNRSESLQQSGSKSSPLELANKMGDASSSELASKLIKIDAQSLRFSSRRAQWRNNRQSEPIIENADQLDSGTVGRQSISKDIRNDHITSKSSLNTQWDDIKAELSKKNLDGIRQSVCGTIRSTQSPGKTRMFREDNDDTRLSKKNIFESRQQSQQSSNGTRMNRQDLDETRISKPDLDETRISKPDLDETRMIKQVPDETRMSRQDPDETRMSRQDPDDTRLSTKNLIESRQQSQQSFVGTRMSRQDPDETRMSRQDPDETRMSRQDPDETRMSRQDPDETRMSRQDPDETRMSRQDPDETRMSRQDPDETRMSRQDPDETRMSRQDFDETKWSQKNLIENRQQSFNGTRMNRQSPDENRMSKQYLDDAKMNKKGITENNSPQNLYGTKMSRQNHCDPLLSRQGYNNARGSVQNPDQARISTNIISGTSPSRMCQGGLYTSKLHKQHMYGDRIKEKDLNETRISEVVLNQDSKSQIDDQHKKCLDEMRMSYKKSDGTKMNWQTFNETIKSRNDIEPINRIQNNIDIVKQKQLNFKKQLAIECANVVRSRIANLSPYCENKKKKTSTKSCSNTSPPRAKREDIDQSHSSSYERSRNSLKNSRYRREDATVLSKKTPTKMSSNILFDITELQSYTSSSNTQSEEVEHNTESEILDGTSTNKKRSGSDRSSQNLKEQLRIASMPNKCSNRRASSLTSRKSDTIKFYMQPRCNSSDSCGSKEPLLFSSQDTDVSLEDCSMFNYNKPKISKSRKSKTCKQESHRKKQHTYDDADSEPLDDTTTTTDSCVFAMQRSTSHAPSYRSSSSRIRPSSRTHSIDDTEGDIDQEIDLEELLESEDTPEQGWECDCNLRRDKQGKEKDRQQAVRLLKSDSRQNKCSVCQCSDRASSSIESLSKSNRRPNDSRLRTISTTQHAPGKRRPSTKRQCSEDYKHQNPYFAASTNHFSSSECVYKRDCIHSNLGSGAREKMSYEAELTKSRTASLSSPVLPEKQGEDVVHKLPPVESRNPSIKPSSVYSSALHSPFMKEDGSGTKSALHIVPTASLLPRLSVIKDLSTTSTKSRDKIYQSPPQGGLEQTRSGVLEETLSVYGDPSAPLPLSEMLADSSHISRQSSVQTPTLEITQPTVSEQGNLSETRHSHMSAQSSELFKQALVQTMTPVLLKQTSAQTVPLLSTLLATSTQTMTPVLLKQTSAQTMTPVLLKQTSAQTMPYSTSSSQKVTSTAGQSQPSPKSPSHKSSIVIQTSEKHIQTLTPVPDTIRTSPLVIEDDDSFQKTSLPKSQDVSYTSRQSPYQSDITETRHSQSALPSDYSYASKNSPAKPAKSFSPHKSLASEQSKVYSQTENESSNLYSTKPRVSIQEVEKVNSYESLGDNDYVDRQSSMNSSKSTLSNKDADLFDRWKWWFIVLIVILLLILYYMICILANIGGCVGCRAPLPNIFFSLINSAIHSVRLVHFTPAPV